VLDWFLSTRVKLEKGVYLQDTTLEDNNMFPIGYQALDIAAAQHSVLAGRSLGGFLHGRRYGEGKVSGRIDDVNYGNMSSG
jgi:hypothetical protein